MRITTVSHLAPLMAGALLLGACGGSSGGSADASADTTAVSETTTTVAETTSTTEAMTGDAGSEYCVLAAEQQDITDQFNDFGDPDAFKAFIEESIARGDQALPIVPAPIADDFATLLDAQKQLYALASDNGFDVLALASEGAGVMDSPEVQAASERLDTYNRDVCGIGTDGATPDTGSASGALDGLGMTEDELAMMESLLQTPAGREAFAQAMSQSGDITTDQALCILDSADFASLMSLATAGAGGTITPEMTSFLTVLSDCGVDPSAFGG